MLAHTNSVDLSPDAANRFACLLVSLAASADALYVYVAHNEYRARKEPKHLPLKGVPVIDTERPSPPRSHCGRCMGRS